MSEESGSLPAETGYAVAEENARETDGTKERRAIGIGVTGFIAGVLCVLLFAIFLPGLAWSEPYIQSAGMGLFLSLIGMLLIVPALRGHSKFWQIMAVSWGLFAIGSILLSYALLHTLNRLMDSSAVQLREGIVIASSSGKGANSTVRLDSPPTQENVVIRRAHRLGHRAVVSVRAGAFGWRWVQGAQVEQTKRR